MPLNFIVRNWSAWAPGLNNPEDWRQWQQGLRAMDKAAPPPAAAVPKSLQRRLSPMAQAVFQAIGQCMDIGESMPAVFSSAHGEIGRCLQMLESLQAGEELSPTMFSLSVHNAIAGLFSMAYGNQSELAVLAPGADGMGPGFIEALGIMREGHAEVLLVFYDEPLPAFFPVAPYAISECFPCALALRLAAGGEGMALGFNAMPLAGQDGEQALQLPKFIEFLVSGQAILQLGEQGRGWQWQKI